jgi:RNA polymerase sigma-70 factor (ECF subfamily)
MHDIPAALGDSVRQQTLTAMYSEHHGWLHNWLRKKLGCSQHAADLAHDAFIRVLMPDPAAIHVALQALERIAEMLAGLPAKAREAFLLSRLDGLTYSEIATRLGVSPSSVKNYISSALVHCYHSLHAADPLA